MKKLHKLKKKKIIYKKNYQQNFKIDLVTNCSYTE